MAASGIAVNTEGPMSKLFSSEALEDHAQELADVVGPDGLRSYFDPTAPSHGTIEHMVRHSLGTTIYAGTSEIHRNMIAQRGLGLPRTRWHGESRTPPQQVGAARGREHPGDQPVHRDPWRRHARR